MVSLAPPPPRHPSFGSELPILLSSFPKSGNTWVRIFLGNYVADAREPLELNDLRYVAHIADVSLFERWVGISPWDIEAAQVTQLRREMHGALHQDVERQMFYKVHDSFLQADGHTPLFPPGCARVVYVVRNPLDVAVSVRHHFDLPSMEAAVDYLGGRPVPVGHLGRTRSQMRQYIGGWSQHVTGWSTASGLDVRTVRYEDLLTDPRSGFETLVRFLRWPVVDEHLERALGASRFERLQSAERANGFAEHYAGHALFFRAGRAGQWRTSLSSPQVEAIVREHGEVMAKFGYLHDL